MVLEVGEQLDKLLREVVRHLAAAVALQREGGLRIASRRAAEAKIDAAGKKPGEHREGLGDLERRIMRQHHAAAAHVNTLGRGGDRSDQRLGAGACQHRRAVMLGNPVAAIAEAVAELREIDAVLKRIGAGRAFGDRCLIEDAQHELLWRGISAPHCSPLLAPQIKVNGAIKRSPERDHSTRRRQLQPFASAEMNIPHIPT
jgi:hypothetical protein